NCLVAMGFPPGHRVWEGLFPSAGLTERLEK
ncbi:TetR family transcriptional regulator, partial [Streptomyces mexicanus]